MRPQTSYLTQHDASQAHGKAAAGQLAAVAAPSVQEFQECLQRRWQGISFRKASDDAGRSKDAKLAFCLSEAVLAREQVALRKAECVTVAQDAQGQLLSVRYAAAVP